MRTHHGLSLSCSQRARRVVEQFVNRHAARYELLLVAEVDDDFQNRPASLDAKSVRIELAAVRQTSGLFACVQLTKDVFDHVRSEEHTSELQSLRHLVCRLLLEKKNRAQQIV